MDTRSPYSHGRPGNLAVSCEQCGAGTPYDPYNTTGLCPPCQNMTFAQTRNGTAPLFPYYSQFPGDSQPQMHTMSTSSLKRYADDSYGDGPYAKRTLLSGYDARDGSVYDDAAAGTDVQAGDNSEIAVDDDEDEFVDAPEEIASDLGEGSQSADSDGDVNVTSEQGEERGGDESGLVEEEGGQVNEDSTDEELDLFESTFGNRRAEDSPDDGDSDDDNGKENLTQNQEKPKSKDYVMETNFAEPEHVNGCKNTRGPSTPPDSPQETKSQPPGPRPPNPDKDISLNLRRQKRFHDRAIDYIPRLPLAKHRYWIGVLNVGVKAENFSKEKDFTWMKGNRLTTVETVWNMYQQVTATDGIVLLLGFERVENKDRVEELDYFNDGKVIFRAVEGKEPGAEGRELCEGLIPKEVAVRKVIAKEVIVIDD